MANCCEIATVMPPADPTARRDGAVAVDQQPVTTGIFEVFCLVTGTKGTGFRHEPPCSLRRSVWLQICPTQTRTACCACRARFPVGQVCLECEAAERGLDEDTGQLGSFSAVPAITLWLRIVRRFPSGGGVSSMPHKTTRALFHGDDYLPSRTPGFRITYRLRNLVQGINLINHRRQFSRLDKLAYET